ncbi:MAG: bifunctional ornithine acetyltransferase/N-acetylglutamate synthase, partial [Candidatus Thermoplasmatota archaeon]|nr:bifunctional ornithine acetyltransferase/N-acetylglutamate synthase [Candidatus Thermoplasmatota archaeon]
MTVELLDEGGLLDVPGFKAHGVHCGLRRKRRDLALILSEHPTTAAATFTKNAFAAAPIQVSKAHLAQGEIQAIVCNSKSANACTGQQGLKDAHAMAQMAGDALGLAPHQVLVASTGVIGEPLEMTKIAKGIQDCAQGLDHAQGGEAAEAITTTDTHPKEVLALA